MKKSKYITSIVIAFGFCYNLHAQIMNKYFTPKERELLKYGISTVDTACAEGATWEFKNGLRLSCCKKENDGFLKYCVGKKIDYANNVPIYISMNKDVGISYSYELFSGTIIPRRITVFKNGKILFYAYNLKTEYLLNSRFLGDTAKMEFNYFDDTNIIMSIGSYYTSKNQNNGCSYSISDLPKNGIWDYYNKSGSIIQKEYWNKGKLLKTIVY